MLKFKIISFLIIFLNLFLFNISANTKEQKIIVRVGVYEDEPYFTIDNDGCISGYYYDLLQLFEKNSNLKFEYIQYDFADGLEELVSGDNIDIMLGLASTPDRKDLLLFNKYRICLEKHSISTNMEIPSGDLYSINGMTLGLIEGGANSQWILDFLQSKEIAVIPVYAKNLADLESLLDEGSIDLIIESAYSGNKYNHIYKFTGHQVYIGASKSKGYLIDYIDEIIEDLYNKTPNPITILYHSYFTPDYKIAQIKNVVFINILLAIAICSINFLIIPKIRLSIIRKRIKSRLINNDYMLYYQPIYNINTNEITGFESLLRLKNPDGTILPPSEFLPEIEDNDMLFDVSLWILKIVFEDYHSISHSINDNKRKYISINLSLREIENDNFVNRAIKLLEKSNIDKNKICLEITEKVKVDNLNTLNRSIKKLKDAGFMIAIDDFGMEYSNLDIIQKLDFDIIKLDKYFIDDVCSCKIKKEIVIFLSKISEISNKILIIEGIEDSYQDILIKSLNKHFISVQGYFYNKPLPLKDILTIL